MDVERGSEGLAAFQRLRLEQRGRDHRKGCKVNTLTGVSAPVGTLLGPGRMGRIMVVIAEVEGGVQVDYAGPEQIRAALDRGDYHSLTELDLQKQRATALRMREQESRFEQAMDAMLRRQALSRPVATLRRHRKHKIGGGR